MRFGVVVFPGTWSDGDCYHVLKNVLHQSVDYVWHRDTDLSEYDCVVLPGGFSYGDYLRAGAIARFSPVMRAVSRFAEEGKPVLGICNGFQILCEPASFPGPLFVTNTCSSVATGSTCGSRARRPRSPTPLPPHRCFASRSPTARAATTPAQDTIAEMEARGGVIFRYCSEDGEITDDANPNGSVANIAGITNEKGNVLGMMPHPERCCEELLGGTHGRTVFESVISSALAPAVSASGLAPA